MKIIIYEDDNQQCNIDTGESYIEIPMDMVDVFIAAMDKFKVSGDKVEIDLCPITTQETL